MTEKWVLAYTKNKNHSDQYHFEDGGWVCYMRGIYDSRDIMSDCVRPSWESSGEYMICLIPAGKRSNSDNDFIAYTDKPHCLQSSARQVSYRGRVQKST